MKNKLRTLAAVALALTVTAASIPTAAPVSAAGSPTVQPRYAYINSASAHLYDNEDDTATFTVSCSGVTNVDTIEMEVVLQKKGLLGIYTKEDEASKTVSKNAAGFTGSFDIDSSKTYRIKYTYTVYVGNDDESDTMYSYPTD